VSIQSISSRGFGILSSCERVDEPEGSHPLVSRKRKRPTRGVFVSGGESPPEESYDIDLSSNSHRIASNPPLLPPFRSRGPGCSFSLLISVGICSPALIPQQPKPCARLISVFPSASCRDDHRSRRCDRWRDPLTLHEGGSTQQYNPTRTHRHARAITAIRHSIAETSFQRVIPSRSIQLSWTRQSVSV
jgi:hypothetical protein